MILVGAINVAAIETVWAGLITPPNSKQIIHKDYKDDRTDSDTGNVQQQFNKGDEMGRFNMGSTVILLFENADSWQPELAEGSPVQLGEMIGQF